MPVLLETHDSLRIVTTLLQRLVEQYDPDANIQLKRRKTSLCNVKSAESSGERRHTAILLDDSSNRESIKLPTVSNMIMAGMQASMMNPTACMEQGLAFLAENL